ncbi:putative transcriptional regulator protein [Pseudorhizobium banfieldiae]|uniref:Putative transcriptional regulator protein n=1 Tax=Pseudorhizobium banfieldiae TaxID=1125847 RepID=L0NGI3_9HYPH|nr:helix-turn-helix domain-containing protein [Pseudorhizobium banfieldiae]CAD6615238.1 helix-turn-helix domain-containing protein [arsenite-oxidising bacterium NT-25]CCF20198.1 putative transcriptional regulator protein [Pseudorhizobium banfieldiae]
MTEIRPIRSEGDYQQAMTLLETLWGAETGTPEGDRLDLLVTLIDIYESARHPIDLPDPVDAILFRMEQQGLTRKDLEPVLGSRGRVAEILNRKRPLSLEMIRRLNAELDIPAEVLIQPIRPAKSAA